MTVRSRFVGLTVVVALLGLAPPSARAGVPRRAARDGAEVLLRWFGKGAETEVTEARARTSERLAIRPGDAVRAGVRPGGPERVPRIEAARIIERPALRALVERQGGDAMRAVIAHPGLAESVAGAPGKSGARALAAVGPRNARRLAMMIEDGSLQQLGRTDENLAVVEKYGDRALDFVWKHKGALTVATVLVTFLADPEPFLGGSRRLTSETLGMAAEPITEGAGRVATWVLIPSGGRFLVVGAVALGLGILACPVLRACRRHRHGAQSP